ncbi:MAG: hypothetical protein JXB32_19705 [Deltaproteobacteria bacterium]|nr:hypothetical protein [Deltaproteobacteria bacterium]
MHDPHELWTLLDRVVTWFGEPPHQARLAEALAAYQQRTGEFEAGRPCYEERVRLFHDWFLFDHVLPTGRVALAEYLREVGPGLAEEQRAVYRGLLAAGHRSLFEVDRSRAAHLRLLDRIGGAAFDLPAGVAPPGLATCDLLDARLLRPGDGEPILARGLLVHPRLAHEAILELVEVARGDAGGPPWELLDVLARMKLAWDRADNPRIPAIYGPGSYLYREFVRALPAPEATAPA